MRKELEGRAGLHCEGSHSYFPQGPLLKVIGTGQLSDRRRGWTSLPKWEQFPSDLNLSKPLLRTRNWGGSCKSPFLLYSRYLLSLKCQCPPEIRKQNWHLSLWWVWDPVTTHHLDDKSHTIKALTSPPGLALGKYSACPPAWAGTASFLSNPLPRLFSFNIQHKAHCLRNLPWLTRRSNLSSAMWYRASNPNSLSLNLLYNMGY